MFLLILISFIQDGLAQERLWPVLSVSPHSWLTEGVSVTLNCEVRDSTTGWTFSWYRAVPHREGLTPIRNSHGYVIYYVEILSNSSRGAGGSYTLSPAALHHTGVYVCRAERGEPAYQTHYSNTQSLWITDVSPPSSLIINPSRTQHFNGDSLTLSCEGQSDSTGWRVRRYTQRWGVSDCSSDWGSVTGSTCTISYLYTSHSGVYWCQSESGGSSNPVNITVHYDVILESPAHPVTEGDPLILRCLLHHTIQSDLRVDIYKDGLPIQNQTAGEITIHTVSKSDEGLYHCKHPQRGESPHSWVSVRETPRAVLSVYPQSWLTEGVSVTLNCEVNESSTGWTFSWYRAALYRQGLTPVRHNQGYVMYYVELLSDSSRGAGGSYTLSPAALHHTGVYVCRGERGEPAYQTQYSNTQPLWITGVSPPSSLIISPSRTQHFIGDSLSLSCERQIHSTGWRVRQYTQSWGVSDCSSGWGSVIGSTCTITSLYSFHTGVYWCQSESGGSSNPVNITVHNGDVILESPIRPVTEGDPLTLRCLLRHTIQSDLRAHIYKDGLLIQRQIAREMTIHSVSKSDEGLYHCKHPQRGESPHSWVSVRALPTATLTVEPQSPVFTGESVTLKCEIESYSNWRYQWYNSSSETAVHQSEINTFTISSPTDQDQYWCRGERDERPTSSQDSNRVHLSVKADQFPNLVLVGLAVGLSLVLLFILLVLLCCYKTNKGVKSLCCSNVNQFATSHTSDQTQRESGDEAADELSEVTYAQIMKHNNKSRNEDGGTNDVTYAEIEMKPKKKAKTKQDKTSVEADTVYSELCQDTHKGQNSETYDRL